MKLVHSLTFEGHDGLLYANGEQFSFKGVNWCVHLRGCVFSVHMQLTKAAAMQSRLAAVTQVRFRGIQWSTGWAGRAQCGLVRDEPASHLFSSLSPGDSLLPLLNRYMDYLQRNNFNAIRLLFNHEHVLQNDIVEAPQEASELFQTRYIDMFLVLAQEAAQRGLLIMIACHRVKHDAWPGAGLWYDDTLGITETVVKDSWTRMASVLCQQWNIVAADLQNEVRHTTALSIPCPAVGLSNRPIPM